MSVNETNRSLALRFFGALNNADRPALQLLLDPAVVWQVPKSAVEPYAGEHHGAEKVIDMMLAAVEHTFDSKGVYHQVLLTVAEGDHVVVETRMQADQPDGRHYDNQYVFVFRIENGRIVTIREHVDTAYAVNFFGQP